MKKENVNVGICPPCGENVGLPTKRGANKENLFGPLLPRLTAVLPPQGREITTRGFTLIELLVVVLIIGILAAVAVPQYQKAVWRNKNVQLKALVSNVAKAQQTYYLANGKYATNLNELDVDVPAWQSRNAMGTSDVCRFTTTYGQDSVRFTDDLSIGLSSGGNIFGTWSTGPYRCGGFSYRANENKIYCTERSDSKAAKNNFCVNLEHAVYSKTPATWHYYAL